MKTISELLPSNQFHLISKSIVSLENIEYGLSKTPEGTRLVIIANANDSRLAPFQGTRTTIGEQIRLIALLTSENAAALRNQIPWLKPGLLGIKTSAGMGDRLGLATPGHIQAINIFKGRFAPIFAQQSMRELARTGRSAQQVIDDAMWGVFQEGWRNGYGADADHLKTTAEIDICVPAGFTFFTIDPGAFVDNRAEYAEIEELREIARSLPIEMGIAETKLLNKEIKVEHLDFTFNEKTLLKAMVKYGNAVWHVYQMYQYLVKTAGPQSFELEVSVDETEKPTSHAEHVYIANELKRLGVKWVSLAPRFVGEFEKGVDYIGDLTMFEEDIRGHAAIARAFGPYKLSLHSGSDKFRIYKIAAQATKGFVHLKTAGTSYLEALRTVAGLNPLLFAEIYGFCREHYEADKASYHVSAQLSLAPVPQKVKDWTALLEDFNAREILHVTFGSVLREKNTDGSFRFYNRIIGLLKEHPESYAKNLEKHFIRHLQPFVID